MLAVLQGLRIPEGHHTRYPVLHRLGQPFDGAVRERGTLAVPAGHDDGCRTEGHGSREQDLHLAYAYRGRAAGDKIRLRKAEVVHSLRGDVRGPEYELEAVGQLGAYFIALGKVSVASGGEESGESGRECEVKYHVAGAYCLAGKDENDGSAAVG